MKKFALCLILAGLLVVPVVASATAVGVPNTVPNNVNVFATLDKIVDLLFAILLIAATIVIVVAAFTFLTSSGDPEKAGSARQMLLYALVAIVVAFLAKGLVALVNSIIR